MGQELYTVKGNAHTSSDLAVRRAMGLSLVLFCTVFGDGPISGMTVEQQDAKNKGFFSKNTNLLKRSYELMTSYLKSLQK